MSDNPSRILEGAEIWSSSGVPADQDFKLIDTDELDISKLLVETDEQPHASPVSSNALYPDFNLKVNPLIYSLPLIHEQNTVTLAEHKESVLDYMNNKSGCEITNIRTGEMALNDTPPMNHKLMCIWYHDQDISHHLEHQIKIYLNRTFPYVRIFIDISHLAEYLLHLLVGLKVVFVIHSKTANYLCSLIKRRPQCYRIYELPWENNPSLSPRDSLDCRIVSRVDQLFSEITNEINSSSILTNDPENRFEDMRGNMKQSISFSFYNLSLRQQSSRFLDKECAKFVFFQLFKKMISHMKHDSFEMMDICRQQYVANSAQMQKVDELMKEYDSSKAIQYYTEDSFLYRTLNEAFRNNNIEHLFLFRWIIADINAQLTQLASQQKELFGERTITVYRGQIISIHELQKFQDNVGNLVCVSSFLSISRKPIIAQIYAETGGNHSNHVNILLEITIDNAAKNSTPFANTTNLKTFPDDEEVLFTLGCVFRIERVERNNSDVWTIKLQLPNDSDNTLVDILKHFKNDSLFLTMGNILRELGDYSNAEFCYNQALGETCLHDETRGLLLYNIGLLASERENYVKALDYFRRAEMCLKAIETVSKEEPAMSLYSESTNIAPSRLTILNNMGLMYQKLDDYEKAYDIYVKALDVQGTVAENAIVHNNLGLLEFYRGKYEQAQAHLTQAVALTKDREFENLQHNLNIVKRCIVSASTEKTLHQTTESINPTNPSNISATPFLTHRNQCYPQHLIIASAKITTIRSLIKFRQTVDDPNMLVVALKEPQTAAATSIRINRTIDSLISSFTSHNVFNLPSDASYISCGSLCLTVSYGHLFLVVPSPLPDSIGDLVSLMNEKQQVVRFKTITVDQISPQIFDTTNSTPSFPYEVYCHFFSTIPKTSNDISLLFDLKKNLRQIRIHHKRTQSYVRDSDADLDCIFELNPTVTHEANTPTFNELLRSIFVSHEATDLLVQETSDILCDFELVKPCVKLIQLKIVTGEYERKTTDEPNLQLVYRTVKNIPLQDQQQHAINTKETIEFCASPIIKRKPLLRLVCQMALALTTNKQQQHHSELFLSMNSNKAMSTEDMVPSEFEYTPKIGEISQLILIPSKTLSRLMKTSISDDYAFMHDDTKNIAIIGLSISLDNKMPFLSYHFESFDDEFEYISRVLSINDKMLFLLISLDVAEDVVPLVYKHYCVEQIFLYGNPHDQFSPARIKQYEKVYGPCTEIVELHKHLIRGIETVSLKPLRWHRSNKLFVMLHTQKLLNTGSPSFKLSSNPSCNACIVIFHCEYRILFRANGGPTHIRKFIDVDNCKQFIMSQQKTQVFLVISGKMIQSDLETILNLNQIHGVYYFRTSQEKYPSDTSKVSGHFNTIEALTEQLRIDIWFHRQQQCHTPRFNVFAEKDQNEKLFPLNDEQISFILFQLFVDILPHIPLPAPTLEEIVDECKALSLETTHGSPDSYDTLTSIANNKQRPMYEDATGISQIIIRTHQRDELQKLLIWQKHFSNINQRMSRSEKIIVPFTVYRAQIVSEEDLTLLQSSLGKLISVGTFFLATVSVETARIIARQATNDGLKAILFEIDVVKETHLVYIADHRIMFRLGAVFRLQSIELAPDGIWYIKIVCAESAFHLVKEQLQFEVGTQLSWLTLVNYLCLLNRSEQAEAYYKCLCQKLPVTNPEWFSLYNNIGNMYMTIGNETEATRNYKLILENIELLKHGTPNNNERQDSTYIQAKKENCRKSNTLIDHSIVSGDIADAYYMVKNYTKALLHYENALELSTIQQYRDHYQQRIHDITERLKQNDT